MADIPNAPKFEGPDGLLREKFIFSTDRTSRHFPGAIDADTVDLQVSVRGAAFSSDPDLVAFEGTTFTVPNPSAFPDGIQLFPGDNRIEIKAVLSNGQVTAIASIDAKLALDRDLNSNIDAPSGVSVERFDRTVTVSVDGIDDPNVVGYNFYASAAPGGGTNGYSLVNPSPITTSAIVERTTDLGTLTSDADIKTKSDGSAAADPLYVAITGEQQDGNEVVLQTDFNQAFEVPETSTRLKTTITIQDIEKVNRFSFTHDRNSNYESAVNPAVPNAEFNAITSSDPLYYVVTALYEIDGDEFESEFSPEVTGSPLVVTPNVGSFPQVSRAQIVRDTTLSVFRSQPQVDLKGGAVVRDTFVDPFATEAERIRFIVDFLHNAQSFATLLPIDDPGFTGISVPVSQSPYKLALKQAFFLQDNAAVQNLLDNAFDHLAAKRGTTRKGGKRARGEVTFHTKTRPSTTRILAIGQTVSAGGVRFRSTSAAQITSSGAGALFNPTTGRYSVRAFIQAEEPGSAGVVAEGQIRTIENGPPGIEVTNESATFGGLDQESNKDLAARADGILSSVDSGTYRGYTETAIGVAGVRQVNVVDSGHPLMCRDLNPATLQHVGGKVDVWLRGENVAKVTDNFAFTFTIQEKVQFEPIGDLQDFKFRAVDANLSAENPIIEMLDIPTKGYEFDNITKGKVMVLTNVKVLTFDTIQLDSTLNDPADVNVQDVFTGSYRYRTSDKYVFTRQPVQAIRSFTGAATLSGTVSPTIYKLFHGSSPLAKGLSKESGDYIQVIQSADGSDTVAIPSAQPVPVTGESHVILDGVEYLNMLGANPLTVRIFSEDRTTEFVSPYDNKVQTGTSADWSFVEDATGRKPLGFLPTSDSGIKEGVTVLVDYEHDENFTVEYDSNAVVAVAQAAIDGNRHITADVLAKSALEIPVDITATVVVRNGATVSVVDSEIRTALTRFFNTFVLGEPVRQADVVGVIDGVTDVSYPVVPLTKMVMGDTAVVVREKIITTNDADFTLVSAWSTALVSVYLLDNPLEAATADSGGEINDYRGVFQGEIQLGHQNGRPDVNGVPLKNATGEAFIIGSTGLSIPGVSDDATLKAQFPLASDAEIDTHRVTLTANRILVSMATGVETPKTERIEATYTVKGDKGVKNLEPGAVSYLTLGNLDLSFDEDRDFAALVSGREE